MTEKDPDNRRTHLEELQTTVSDPVSLRANLVKSSRHDGLEAAAAII